MIKICDNGRGLHMESIKLENRKKVKDWFLKNPGGMQKDCQIATGLSPLTVRNHIKAILKDQEGTE